MRLRTMILGVSAIVLCGCSIEPNVDKVGYGSLPRDSNIVRTVQEMLNAGEALSSKGWVVPENWGTEGFASEAEHKACLKALRERFPPGTRYYYMHGYEFHIGSLSREQIRIHVWQNAKEAGAGKAPVFTLPAQRQHQAYLRFDVEKEKTARFAVHVLVWDCDGAWRFANVSSSICRSGRWNFERAFEAAQKEDEAGHIVAAAGLYCAADVLSRCPDYMVSPQRRGFLPHFQAFAKKVADPSTPLCTVSTDDGDFEIVQVNAEAFIDGLGLYLTYFVEELDDRPVLEARHRKIMQAFWKAHPEVKDYFVVLIVAAQLNQGPRKGQGYRTVGLAEEIENGFAKASGTDPSNDGGKPREPSP